MNNARIADVFEEVADLLEFRAANPFRVRAYRKGAQTLRDLPEPVTAILADPQRDLTDIPGIGQDLADKCATLVATGQLPLLNELLAEIPESVLGLMRIPGLGPKRAAQLYKELHVTTLAELKAACEAGRVRGLKGFGAKTEQGILAGMHVAETAQVRMLWAEADVMAQALLAHLRGCPAVAQLETAGSYRRGKETIGDLDALVVSQRPGEVMDALAQFAEVVETLSRGETKMSVRTERGLQIDLRVVPAESFGAALQYFTGSKEHNVVLRGRARQQGLKVNEYGVFRLHGTQEQYVAGRTEAEVYAALQLPLFPPELREGRQEFQWADEGRLPRLIELDEIRGDLHMHTTETDGKATLEEMVAAARQRGREYIAITDHSQRVTMARGMDGARLVRQWKQIDRLNQRLGGDFVVLKGVECDILENGRLDLPDDILAQADWVLASVHYGQKQPREQITARILGALENPHVSAIAHPTGRLIHRRDPYDVDLDAVIQAAARHGKMLELNANPMRLDLNDVHSAAARSRGVPIVIGTDAHSTDGLDTMRYGVLQARRAGLTRRDVANTRTLAQFRKLLARGR